MGDYVFANCPLETLYLGRNHSCEGLTFGHNNKTLTSVTIGENVKNIPAYAFCECTGLTSVTIPNSVISIGESAFEDCTSLTSIVIGDGVTSIGSSAFEDCRGLTSIVIGDGVTSIGASAFNRCTGLTSVVIPNSVTSIGSDAFYNCSSLTSVIIGDNVTSIGNSAFRGCFGLTSIEIPNSVTSIESGAFNSCTGLTSVIIGDSVTSIGEYAFANCTNLTAVHIRDVATWCNIDFNNYSANPLYYAHNLYLNGEKMTDLVIPDNVTSIGYMAFINCTSLTSIVIPNSVTSIGDYAFEDCTGLKTVINLSNLTFSKGSSNNGYIVYYANKVYNSPEGFIENEVLLGKINGVNTLVAYFGNDAELTLPADYKGEDYVIGAEAFSGKTTLTSIEIPNSVTSIGNYAFKGCTGLKEVHINDLSAWCGINFGSNDANPLYYARNLYLNGEMVTDLEIPDGVTSIENYAFINCTGLTNVVVSDGIDVIGESAFSGCSNVETVYISNTIYSIGNNAFAGCNKIYDIKVGAKKPIGGNENIFASTVYDNATLYIPGGTKSLYEKRVPWNKFFYIKEMDFTGIDELKGEDVKLKGVCYDLSGRAVENPTNGIYIIDGKKVMVK